MTRKAPAVEWIHRIDALLAGRHTTTGDELDAGAELVVGDPGGWEVFRAVLARHHRVDADEPRLVWVRPITGGYTDERTGLRLYDLNVCRRRALSYTDAQVRGSGVVLSLDSGQTACITAASPEALAELQAWDTFTLNILTTEEERELSRLSGDTWTGRFA
jgi:hypothetical protein